MRALAYTLGGFALLLSIAADHLTPDQPEPAHAPRHLGDPGSADLGEDRTNAHLASLSREEAEGVLDQAEPYLREARDPITLAEITENGNMVIAGKAELLVITCDGDETAHIADLTLGNEAPKPDALANRIGSRCSASVLANKDRPVRGSSRCRTFVCFADDELWKRANPEE